MPPRLIQPGTTSEDTKPVYELPIRTTKAENLHQYYNSVIAGPFFLQQKNCSSSSSHGSVLKRITKHPIKIAAIATANHSYWYPSSLLIAKITEHKTDARGTIVIIILQGIEYCLKIIIITSKLELQYLRHTTQLHRLRTVVSTVERYAWVRTPQSAQSTCTPQTYDNLDVCHQQGILPRWQSRHTPRCLSLRLQNWVAAALGMHCCYVDGTHRSEYYAK